MKYSKFKLKVKSLPVFSSSMLGALTEKDSLLRVQLAMWKKKGLVCSLRRGLYVLGSEDRQIEPSLFYLANQIFMPSYVSLESALAYHGLIPEFVAATTSITARKTSQFKNEFGLFTYQHIKPECFTGFESVEESKQLSALVATPEKAVVDFLYLNASKFDTSDESIFLESYRFQNGNSLSQTKLVQYSNLFKSKKLTEIVKLFIKRVMK